MEEWGLGPSHHHHFPQWQHGESVHYYCVFPGQQGNATAVRAPLLLNVAEALCPYVRSDRGHRLLTLGLEVTVLLLAPRIESSIHFNARHLLYKTPFIPLGLSSQLYT